MQPPGNLVWHPPPPHSHSHGHTHSLDNVRLPLPPRARRALHLRAGTAAATTANTSGSRARSRRVLSRRRPSSVCWHPRQRPLGLFSCFNACGIDFIGVCTRRISVAAIIAVSGTALGCIARLPAGSSGVALLLRVFIDCCGRYLVCI
jgi:hypothetical protein